MGRQGLPKNPSLPLSLALLWAGDLSWAPLILLYSTLGSDYFTTHALQTLQATSLPESVFDLSGTASMPTYCAAIRT